MRWTRLFLSVALLYGALDCRLPAQSPTDGAQDLRDAILNKQLYLRGFNRDDLIHWRWEGANLIQDRPRVYTAGVFSARSVKMTGRTIKIEGGRQTLLRSSPTDFELSGVEEPVIIKVELAGGRDEYALSRLIGVLFYSGREEALADLPAGYRQQVPAESKEGCCGIPKADLKACDCAGLKTTTCNADTPSIEEAGMTAPTIISFPNPKYPKGARKAHASGKVGFEVALDESGLPQDIWLLKSAGRGMDANAAEAISRYRFKPATCHGKPTAVQVFIDTSFDIFD